jgi:hypothetical protein
MPISRVHYWCAVSVLLVVWAGGLAWWARNGPAHPKMDAVGWVVAGTMLRDGKPAASLYALRIEQLTIEVERAPGLLFGGPKELTLTRVLPGEELVAGAQRLGYHGSDPPAFVYSPGAALLGIPLSWLGWPAATLAIDMLGLLALAGATALILTRLRGMTWSSLAWQVGLLVLFALTHPLRFSLFLGQVTPILAAGWIVASLSDNRRGQVACGVIIGLLGVLKVFPLLLLLWFVLRRRWLPAAVAAAIFVAGGVVLGIEALSAWVATARQMTAPVRVWTDNQSLAAMLHRFIYPLNLVRDWVIVKPAPAMAISLCVGVLMVACWIWRALKTGRDSLAENLRLFGALWILPMSLGSLFWSHYIVLVLPALAVVLADPARHRASLCLGWIVGVLIVVGADTWTGFMPGLEGVLGSELAAFAMRLLVSLPAMAMMTLFFLLLMPTREEEPETSRGEDSRPGVSPHLPG